MASTGSAGKGAYEAQEHAKTICLRHPPISLAELDQVITQNRHNAKTVQQAPEKFDLLWSLVVLYWLKYLRSPSDDIIWESVTTVAGLMDSLETGDIPLFFSLLAAGELHMHAFHRWKEPSFVEMALMFTTPNTVIHGKRLDILAGVLFAQYTKNPSKDTLEQAAIRSREAAQVDYDGDPFRHTALNNAIVRLSVWAKLTLDYETFDEISALIDKVMPLASVDEQAQLLTTRTRNLLCKFSKSQSLRDLSEALTFIDAALDLTLPGTEMAVYRKTDKLTILQARSTLTGEPEDCDRTFNCAEDCLASAKLHSNTDCYAPALKNYGNICQERYYKTGSGLWLDRALAQFNLLSPIINTENNFYSAIVSTHALVLLATYKHTSDEQALWQALLEVQEAMLAETQGLSKVAEHRHLLSMILVEQAALTLNVKDFEAALKEAKDSLANLSPYSHSISESLFNISSISLHLYRLRPEPNIIQDAIDYGLKCLDVQTGGKNRHAEVHNLLSNAHFARFELEHGREDLDRSIELGRSALIDPADPNLPEFLGNLASKLRLRAVRHGSQDDIDEALKQIRAAHMIKSCPPRIQLFVLGILSQILLDAARLHKDGKYLTKARVTAENWLEKLSDGSESRPDALMHLGNVLYQTYQFSEPKDLEALKRAIIHGQSAYDLCPPEHFKKVVITERLANWRMERNHADDKKEAVQLFNDALGMKNAVPIFRVRAGRQAAKVYIDDKKWSEAFKCLRKILSLFPRLSPRSLSRSDQQFALSELNGIAALAASCAIRAGLGPKAALEVLESGRGIISSWHIQSRNDISDLRIAHPHLAEEYTLLRDRLTMSETITGINGGKSLTRRPVGGAFSTLDVSSVAINQNRRNTASALSELEKKIRNLDRFSSFQQPLSSHMFMEMAGDETIIAVNISTLDSNAFIIRKKGIKLIPLSDLDHDDLVSKLSTVFISNHVAKGNTENHHSRNGRLRDFLSWLWDKAVAKILSESSIPVSSASKPLPRVFWILNGLGSFCPFHAAGYYQQNSSENAPSRIMSTYLTSLRSLKFSQERSHLTALNPQNPPLILTMDRTLNEINLSATQEATKIVSLFKSYPGFALPEIILQPSKAQALEEIMGRSLVHFCCHGFADPVDPSQSHLLLDDKLDESAPDRLSVKEIIDADCNTARLAFLSACSTAENASVNLLDENIHLASAFQLAGFTHVIGTLWSVGDTATIEVATKFYENLLGTHARGTAPRVGGSAGSGYSVCYALHQAVKHLRETKPPGSTIRPMENLLSWVPFVHFGP